MARGARSGDAATGSRGIRSNSCSLLDPEMECLLVPFDRAANSFVDPPRNRAAAN